MATVAPPELVRATAPRAVFSRIVCGVDATRSSAEAGAQALALAEATSVLALTAVVADCAHRPSPLVPWRAQQAMDALGRTARRQDRRATTRLVPDADPVAGLLGCSGEADLVVLGARRDTGLGTTASTIVQRAATSVLVARRAPGASPFPTRILVASDGSDGARAAVELAAALAERLAAEAMLVHAGDLDGQVHARIADDADVLAEATATRPVVLREDGDARSALPRAAARAEASLVMLGGIGTGGRWPLGGVAAQVAAAGPCSVLVARPAG